MGIILVRQTKKARHVGGPEFVGSQPRLKNRGKPVRVQDQKPEYKSKRD